MSLDPPAYLASLQNNIRQRLIPWEGEVRAGTLAEDQLAKIRAVDRGKKDDRIKTVQNDIEGYVSLFVGGSGQQSVFEKAKKRIEVVQYCLVLLSDLLDVVPSLTKSLVKTKDPYQDFLPLLGRSNTTDDPIPILTATVLTKLISLSKDESQATREKALPMVFTYFSSLTKNSDSGLQDIGVLDYSSLLYSKPSRQQFWAQRSETVAPLVDILRSACGVTDGDASGSLWSGTTGTLRGGGFEGSLGGGVGLQLLYHVLLVLWQLSFDGEDVGDDLNDEYDIILLYAQLLRLSPKEKTTRLLVSTLYNLLRANQRTLLPGAVLVRLPAILNNISGRQFTDTDLQEDASKLSEMLEEYTKTKTNFDEYVVEVQSGHLRWSPPHKSSVFWAENARKIIDYNHGECLKKMADIMAKPWENDMAVLAIACNDVGWLVKEVPEQRGQLEKLGIKRRVMELMGSEDEAVRWESLRALGGWLKYSFE